jgi:hypothetical protein
MKTIKIINSLHITDKGVTAKAQNGKPQEVHLRQGDLDGACAVYSTMMTLILIRAVKQSDVQNLNTKHDKRSSIGRLVKVMLDSHGLHRQGNYLGGVSENSIERMLKENFSRKVIPKYFDLNGKESVGKIKELIARNHPIVVGITFKRRFEHAIVAIGYEVDENDRLTKIFCLDPGYQKPMFTYWNSVIEIDKGSKVFNCLYITETGERSEVKIDDILLIEKKN